jgi:hypothetical protein
MSNEPTFLDIEAHSIFRSPTPIVDSASNAAPETVVDHCANAAFAF